MPELQHHEKPCENCQQVAGHHSAHCAHSFTDRYGSLAPHFKTQGDIERRPAPAAPQPEELMAEPVAVEVPKKKK